MTTSSLSVFLSQSKVCLIPILIAATVLAFLTSGFAQDSGNPITFKSPEERISSLLALRFGFGAETVGGAEGVMTEITSLTDGSLLEALSDDTPRWIYFHPSLDGQTWLVPDGSTSTGKNKTIDGRDVSITWQYGIPDNNRGINLPPVQTPVKSGQLNAQHGELIMVGITHVGDLGWPYAYESPWFSNGATDGLEIWDGSNYWIHDNVWKRMSDESLGVYHSQSGTPDKITFSRNQFLETKTGSLIGSGAGTARGRITIAYNLYNTMVNGRSPGEFRNMDAHVYHNVIGYVNDEGMRVGTNARVISERNVFDMGCNSAVSGPRVIRYVLPNETPRGILYSEKDFVSEEASSCPHTLDEGFITAPDPRPFAITYQYELLDSREKVLSEVGIPR
ncbi:MAG: hypothetical protein P1U89_14830 [Verrucomicrobiales bacterium]|nr:hypothetical protein [Verrucomicrobiales bacterium]